MKEQVESKNLLSYENRMIKDDYFTPLSDEDLLHAYVEMKQWRGIINPPEEGILEEIQLKYLYDGAYDVYFIMLLDLYKEISDRWADERL